MLATLVKQLLKLGGKDAILAIVGFLAASDYFKEFVHSLIMNRLTGLHDKYPVLYDTVDGYAEAISELPAVFTDDNPNNVDQAAALFALKLKLEANLAQVADVAKKLEVKSREIKRK